MKYLIGQQDHVLGMDNFIQRVRDTKICPQIKTSPLDRVNPLAPNMNMQILITSLHISYGNSWENLLKHQDNLSLMIIPSFS